MPLPRLRKPQTALEKANKVPTMTRRNARALESLLRGLLGAAALCAAIPAGAATDYVPITPTMNERTVTLNGRNLTIEQIVMVARYGAKVELRRRTDGGVDVLPRRGSAGRRWSGIQH
jgi:hypothetical protein